MEGTRPETLKERLPTGLGPTQGLSPDAGAPAATRQLDGDRTPLPTLERRENPPVLELASGCGVLGMGPWASAFRSQQNASQPVFARLWHRPWPRASPPQSLDSQGNVPPCASDQVTVNALKSSL